MDLKKLRYFVTIMDEGNISRAAEKLHMSQPPLSQQLKQLEEELNIKLFERSTRQLKATEAGHTLYKRALQLLDLASITESEMSHFSDASSGSLRLGFVASAGGTFMPEKIQEYHEVYPNVDYHIREGSTHKILELIDQGIIELGLVKTPFNIEEYNHLALQSEPMIAVSNRNLSKMETTIELTELKNHPLILDKRFEPLITEACHQEGFIPQILCRGEDSRTLLLWASYGIGLAILPMSAIGLLPSEKIVMHRIKSPQLETQTVIVWSKKRDLSKASKYFLDLYN